MTLDAERLAELRRLAEETTKDRGWFSAVLITPRTLLDLVDLVAEMRDEPHVECDICRDIKHDPPATGPQELFCGCGDGVAVYTAEQVRAERDALRDEVEALAEERERLLHQAMGLQARLTWDQGEVERLRGLLRELVEWDHLARPREAWCPLCDAWMESPPGRRSPAHPDGCPWPRVVEEARAEEGEA